MCLPCTGTHRKTKVLSQKQKDRVAESALQILGKGEGRKLGGISPERTPPGKKYFFFYFFTFSVMLSNTYFFFLSVSEESSQRSQSEQIQGLITWFLNTKEGCIGS